MKEDLIEDSFSPEWVKPLSEIELNREQMYEIFHHFQKKKIGENIINLYLHIV